MSKKGKPKTTVISKPKNWSQFVQKTEKPISKVTKTEKPNAVVLYITLAYFICRFNLLARQLIP